MRHIDTLVVHHSAGHSGSVEAFRQEHKAKGWADIGYHYVIGNGYGQGNGVGKQGRPDSQIGAGVWGNNTGKLHVCLVGNFEDTTPTPQQLLTLKKWIEEKSKKYGCYNVKGHKEITRPGHATLCPGKYMPMGIIRNWPLVDKEIQRIIQGQQKFAKADSSVSAVAVGPTWLPVSSSPKALVEATPAGREVIFIDQAGNRINLGAAISVQGATYITVVGLAQAMGWHIIYSSRNGDPITLNLVDPAKK